MEQSFNKGASKSRNTSQNNQNGTQMGVCPRPLASLLHSPALEPRGHFACTTYWEFLETTNSFSGFRSLVRRTPGRGGRKRKVTSSFATVLITSN